jgi:hypothetical protein
MSEITLKPYQKIPIEHMKTNYGLLLYHSVGSGKTITALMSMYQFVNDIIIIGPKSSKKTFADEISKLNLKLERFTIYTFKKVKQIIYEDFDLFTGKCVIIDEAHHLRNETKDVYLLASLLQTAHKVILLTATPIVNYLNDLSPLINIVRKENVLPLERELFEFFYFDVIHLSLKNEEILKKKIQGCISYYQKDDGGDYPKTITHYKGTVMNIDQIEAYAQHVRRFIYDYQVPMSTSLFDVKFDYLNKGKLNSFLGATRMISNTVNSQRDTPKIVEVIKIIKEKVFPIVVYSNFLENGLYPISSALNELNISNKMITGKTSIDKLILIVNEYNSRKFDVLLLSSAGSESITLKNTRQLHILEPHFNDAKINQVIGRVVRYKSHEDLDVSNRIVNVYHWFSIFPSNYNNLSADEFLIDLSRIKTGIINAFDRVMIETSIEVS